jgi:hypothetical protein
VDAATGSNSNPGTSGSPWATLSHARANAGSGATICVRNGNYGSFNDSAPPAIATKQVFRNDVGHNPTVSHISINYASKQDAKLTISGFTVYKSSGGAAELVYVNNATNFRATGLNASSYKWAVAGSGVECGRITNSDDVIFDHNYCHNVHVGVMYQDTNGVRILNNNLECTAGSGVRNVFHNTNSEIGYNHIHGVGWTPDGDSPPSPHASIISNRSDSIIIRGNHMHGMGNSSGVMFYGNQGPGGLTQYDDILFENNVIYDTINIYAMRIYHLGYNVVVRNNVFYPGHSEPTGICPDQTFENRLFRPKNGFIIHDKAAGPGIKFYNNLVVGVLNLNHANIDEEYNNYVWSWNAGGTWLSSSPSGTSAIVHSTAGTNCTHSELFEDGTFFNSPINGWFPGTGSYPMDLAPGSPGENFGDPTKQPAGSLGSLDADGFVRPGPCRDSGHSVGAYEFGQ